MAEIPLNFFYSDGVMTLTNGSDIVTGKFTSWDPGVQPMDIVFPNDGQSGVSVVDEVLSANQLRLAKPWTGPTLTDVPYFILRWIKHTDPRRYGLMVSEYLSRLRQIPENLVEVGQQIAEDAEQIALDRIAVASDAAATEQARQQAVASAEAAKEISLGKFAADPTTRPDGSPLQEGDTYTRTTTPKGLRIYLDGAWTAAAVDANGAALKANNLSDLPDRAEATRQLLFKPDADAVARPVEARLGDRVSILDYGGSDDGVTDNAGAWAKAKAAAGPNGVVWVPRTRANSVYRFATFPALGGVFIDNDAGVKFSGFVSSNDPDVKVRHPLELDFDSGDGTTYSYTLAPKYKPPLEERPTVLSEGDIDRTRAEAIDCTTLLVQRIGWPTSDLWEADGSGALAPDHAQWNIALDNYFHGAFLPVRGGQEITATFGAIQPHRDAQYLRAAIVRSTGGYMMFYSDGTGAGTLAIKNKGGTAVTVSIDWPARATHPNWQFSKSHITIRIHNNKQWSLLINGREIFDPQTVEGEIEYAGFGGFGTQAAAQPAYVSFWSRLRRSDAPGKPDIALGISGDSNSVDLHGAWPEWTRAYLDGSFGIRVNGIVNKAIAGQGVSQQLAKLMNEGTGGATHWIISLGTNDSFPSPSNFRDDVATMIDYLQSAGVKVLLGVFPLYLNRATGYPTGIDAPNIANLSGHRAALLKLAGTKGVPVVDLNQVLGPLNSSHLDMLFDNIHHSPFAKKLIGYAFARGLAGLCVREMTQRVPETDLPADRLLNGWTMAPRYSVSEDGVVSLWGPVFAGVKDAGTQFYTLPANLRPKTSKRFPVYTDDGTIAMVLIQPDGAMFLYNLDAANYISLDGIRFEAS